MKLILFDVTVYHMFAANRLAVSLLEPKKADLR